MSEKKFKVAYNGCFGGFSLSRSAVKRAREISGDLKWSDIVLPGEKYGDTGEVREEPKSDLFDSYHLRYGHPRHDPVLIQVIEEMRDDASGPLAALLIAEVSGVYQIEEYDGRESVFEPGDMEWIDPTDAALSKAKGG